MGDKIERSNQGLILLGIVFILAGTAFAVFAEAVLFRFSDLAGAPADRLWLMRGFGIGAIVIGGATILEAQAKPPTAAILALAVVAVGCFVAFTQQLSGWWIDDAGITFAYSRSVMEGAGPTFAPGAAPTEGYSSSFWMLILAALGKVGFDIPAAAKFGGILCGVLVLLGAMHIAWKETQSPAAIALTAAGIATSPFVVWSASGQEHALQALILFGILYAALFSERWRLWVTLLLSILVLTRPEAPIIVAAIFATLVLASWREKGVVAVTQNVGIALVPFAVFCALIFWRVTYFGDPLPNPYYAKTSDSSLTGLVNPFGSGWRYVLGGMLNSALIIVVALFFFPTPKTRSQRTGLIILGLLAGHFFFVIWAKGDWMGEYRFLMPVIPLIVLAVIPAFRAIDTTAGRVGLSSALSLILLVNTVTQLDRFAAQPTTPLSVVSEVGRTFADLSVRLGILDPLLAHHDAGAISYERSVGLLDLGGLVDRDVAKNMGDRAFLEDYVFAQRKPDFVFGTLLFAAETGFTQAPEFARDYIPLEFENNPVMISSLSHIRRELARDVPGIQVDRDADGAPVKVVYLAN
jgi:hypothetical protein